MKKLFSWLLTFALATVMAVSFVACDGGAIESDAGEVDGATGATVVKVLFHVDEKTDEGQAYKKRIEAFNVAYKEKGIKASATYKARSAGASGYETELMNSQASKTLADIITFDAPNTAAYAKSKLLYDISELVPEDVKNDFYSLNAYGDGLYGLPIQESSAGFYYNKKIFRRLGIDVSAYTVENPWTFEQFKEVCQRLEDGGVTPVDMRLDATKDETATYLLYPFIYAAGGEFSSPDGYTATGYFDSQETLNGFNFIKSLISEGYTSYTIGPKEFFNENVGMYLSSGWTIPEIDHKFKENFESRNDWGILPYPKSVKAASATGSWSYGITNNHHQDKTAIKEVLLWLASTESSDAITTATGMIPARKSVNKNYEVGSPEYVLVKQLELSGRERPVTVAYPQFSTSFNQIIDQLGATNNVAELLATQTNNLQEEMDRLARR